MSLHADRCESSGAAVASIEAMQTTRKVKEMTTSQPATDAMHAMLEPAATALIARSTQQHVSYLLLTSQLSA